MDLLSNTVQPYAWGSRTAIPRLMGTPPTGEPQAELWMGAHPAAPSRVDRGRGPLPLDRVLRSDPATELGTPALRRFGPRLPFLLKLLAADAPLSLQVHPDPAQAEAGFALENALGVPLDAPHRTYRDPHHKPEMIVALTPFQGLCGFRSPRQCADLLDALAVPALRPHAEVLRTRPEEAALAEVFAAFLSPPEGLLGDVTAAVAAVAAHVGPHQEDLVRYAEVARAHPGDPGLLAALMLRRVELRPGESLFLGAGVPHAYLSGLGVEIMANSDNVLRCGLTSKHVDAAELLRVVRFTAPPGRVLTPGERAGEEIYPVPVDDFRLSRFRLGGAERPRPLPAGAPQIVLCVEGAARLTSAATGDTLRIGPGRSLYVPAAEAVSLAGEGVVFRATVGIEVASDATPVLHEDAMNT
ncbi:mannose-6-phosphate isomerase, class I [Streptomyces litmocidini]|uniref:mannose-6-phosphate isomerase, class I n=1 Tax=Streptomyces litmocidini TaxID=67318 RepID=UPI00167CA4AF|nr:mannose-6-phosphate isomerase, class I [Streptomyces litmocidini]GGU97028.1 mannose-6-phosphate isomerase, class I [Streptomyces litmocidini]